MIFHSIPSSNIPKTTPVAGCSSSRKKDKLNRKGKIMFRLYFLLLAREKAGVMAQQEMFGTKRRTPWLRPRQHTGNTWHRGSKMPVAWEGEIPHRYVSTGEHVKAISACVVPKPPSGQEPHSRCQAPPRGEASPEGPTTQWPPRWGCRWGWWPVSELNTIWEFLLP